MIFSPTNSFRSDIAFLALCQRLQKLIFSRQSCWAIGCKCNALAAKLAANCFSIKLRSRWKKTNFDFREVPPPDGPYIELGRVALDGELLPLSWLLPSFSLHGTKIE